MWISSRPWKGGPGLYLCGLAEGVMVVSPSSVRMFFIPTTVLAGGHSGGYCTSMGYRGPCNKPSGPCIIKMRILGTK